MQTELEQWEQENAAPCRFFMPEAQDVMMVPLDAVRALLAGKVLCNAEPVGYLYQHEDSGRTTSVSAQAHDCGFERLNPRYTLIGPLHKPADIGKEGA
jgi:hypothetical protein